MLENFPKLVGHLVEHLVLTGGVSLENSWRIARDTQGETLAQPWVYPCVSPAGYGCSDHQEPKQTSGLRIEQVNLGCLMLINGRFLSLIIIIKLIDQYLQLLTIVNKIY